MNATERERQRNREMILSPYKWPLFYLPLKRKRKGDDGFPEIALLRSAVSKDTYPLHVDINRTIYGPISGEVKEVVYENVDALLDDGWEVD